MIEQMRRETMTQHVRRYAFRIDAGDCRVSLHREPEHLSRHRSAAVADENFIDHRSMQKRRPRFFVIAFDPILRLLTKRHQSLFSALAGDAHDTLAQIELLRANADQFADTQT